MQTRMRIPFTACILLCLCSAREYYCITHFNFFQYELCKKIRRYSKEYDAFHTYFFNLFWKTFEIPVFLSSKHIQTQKKESSAPLFLTVFIPQICIFTYIIHYSTGVGLAGSKMSLASNKSDKRL